MQHYAVWPAPDSTKRRLIVCPYAGGATAAFKRWRPLLDQATDLVVLRYPGRETRISEAPITDFTTLLDDLMVPMSVLAEHKPYLLLGHSLGALIAYRLALQLRAAGLPEPQHLLVSGRAHPELLSTTQYHQLDDQALLTTLQDRYGGVPQQVWESPEILRYFLPILRGDLRILASYQPLRCAPLQQPVTAVYNADDRLTAEQMEGWHSVSTASVSIRLLPGDHFSLLNHPADFLDLLNAVLTAIN